MSFSKSIKNFIKNILDLFRQWYKQAEDFVKDNVHVAVVFTEGLKKFVENPVGDFLLTFLDDKVPIDLKEKVKQVLPKVLVTLHIIDNCQELSFDDTLICVAAQMEKMSKETKDHFLHSLSVELARVLSDGKLTLGEAIALVEWYYRSYVKK